MTDEKRRPYKSTPIFNESSLPMGLRQSHRTKSGVWAVLEILSGQIVFIDEARRRNGEVSLLTAGARQLIQPDSPHHLELLGPVSLQVHFFHEAPPDC